MSKTITGTEVLAKIEQRRDMFAIAHESVAKTMDQILKEEYKRLTIIESNIKFNKDLEELITDE